MSEAEKKPMTTAEYMKTQEYWDKADEHNRSVRFHDELMKYGGGKTYCVLTPKEYCWTGQIYIHADSVCIKDGALQFFRTHSYHSFNKKEHGYLYLEDFKVEPLDEPVFHTAFAAGTWNAFHQSSSGCHGCFGIQSWPGYRFLDETTDPEPAACWAEVANGQPATPEPEKKDNRPNSRNIGDSLRFDVLKRSNFRCVYCGRDSKGTALEIDHIKPFSKGGTNELNNLQAVCARCNRGKSNKPVEIAP